MFNTPHGWRHVKLQKIATVQTRLALTAKRNTEIPFECRTSAWQTFRMAILTSQRSRASQSVGIR